MENNLEAAKTWMKANGELVEGALNSWYAAEPGLSPIALLLFSYASQFAPERPSDEEIDTLADNASLRYVLDRPVAYRAMKHMAKIILDRIFGQDKKEGE